MTEFTESFRTYNQGNIAGLKSRSVNLGSGESPRLVAPDNCLDLFVEMDQVADENDWKESSGWRTKSEIKYFMVREEVSEYGEEIMVLARVAPDYEALKDTP